jgi:hypothetical protein
MHFPQTGANPIAFHALKLSESHIASPSAMASMPPLVALASAAGAPAAGTDVPAAATCVPAAATDATAAAAEVPDPTRTTRCSATPAHVVAAPSPSARNTTLSVSLPMIRVNASVLKSISGFGDMDDMLFQDKVLRKMAPGQLDIHEEDASDKIAVADVVAALLGMSADGARQWLNNNKHMNKEIAPSLSYVKGTNVCFLN